MKKTIVAATALTAVALGTLAATPAYAQDEAVSFSANVALVSDYRFRGVSLSDEDPAIQGGFEVGTAAGFYIGTWGSSIEQFNGAETEVDVYGGWAGTFGLVDLDVGVIGYLYPGGTGTDYYELYGSVGSALGPLGVALSVAYAPDQNNLGDQDNFYINLGGEFSVPDTPLTLNASIGRETGAFGEGPGDAKWDWTVGASLAYGNYSFGLAYIDTDIAGGGTDATVVASLGASF